RMVTEVGASFQMIHIRMRYGRQRVYIPYRHLNLAFALLMLSIRSLVVKLLDTFK
ncbi:hypothetical protein J6590_106015, partial [Homalodisca vitripennis]